MNSTKLLLFFGFFFSGVYAEEIKIIKPTSDKSSAEIVNSSISKLAEYSICFRFYQNYFKIPSEFLSPKI